jgi:KGK domain
MNESNHKFKPLQDEQTAIALPSSMFKQKDLLAFINEAFRGAGLNRLGEIIWDRGRGKIPLDKHEEKRTAWFSDGIECEVLTPNSSGWQKGKVRINVSIEFCPDTLERGESETETSPLNWLR